MPALPAEREREEEEVANNSRPQSKIYGMMALSMHIGTQGNRSGASGIGNWEQRHLHTAISRLSPTGAASTVRTLTNYARDAIWRGGRRVGILQSGSGRAVFSSVG